MYLKRRDNSRPPSRQVHREVNRAFSKGVTVVPLRIENVTPAGRLKQRELVTELGLEA
jgi:hypothetical protein